MKNGFTIIELLAVIVILSILITASVMIVRPIIINAQKESFLDSAKGFMKAAQNYYSDEYETLSFPTDDNDQYDYEFGITITAQTLYEEGYIKKYNGLEDSAVVLINYGGRWFFYGFISNDDYNINGYTIDSFNSTYEEGHVDFINDLEGIYLYEVQYNSSTKKTRVAYNSIDNFVQASFDIVDGLQGYYYNQTSDMFAGLEDGDSMIFTAEFLYNAGYLKYYHGTENSAVVVYRNSTDLEYYIFSSNSKYHLDGYYYDIDNAMIEDFTELVENGTYDYETALSGVTQFHTNCSAILCKLVVGP